MGRVAKRKMTLQNDVMEDLGWEPAKIDNEEKLSLFTAACQIVEVANDSNYNPKIYEAASRPIAYISDMLGLTAKQALVYSMVMHLYYDKQISTMDLGRILNIPPLKAMIFSEDLEELCRRKFLVFNFDDDSPNKSYHLTREAMDSMQENRPINEECTVMNSCEEWFNALDNLVTARCQYKIDYDAFRQRLEDLIALNKELPMLKRFKAKSKALKIEDVMMFMWICSMVVNDNFETIVPENFKKLYGNLGTFRSQRKALTSGTSPLIKEGLLRVARNSEQRVQDCFELTPWVIKDMLAELELDVRDVVVKDIIRHSSITEKHLFYNPKEQRAIDQLSSLLQPKRFTEACNELKNLGFRSGFACLFHGAPGTGKTETVLQLARATGRDLMQVNISEIKSMWVGESEKNIKGIFSRYRKLVEESDVAPILLFNEADAIIGKRLENVSRSVDKMENSMQNIILEEIEKLDGILIATTNLTSNMDSAFERRFLYKVEFEKPAIEVKSSIWQSMITGLSTEDASVLASKYDFSGGQIENIARKSVVSKIISGEELSLNSLIAHCDTELIGKSVRRRIGF